MRSLIKAIAYLQTDWKNTPEPDVGEELSVKFLVHGLLNGRFRIPVFDRLSALHISDDSRLIRCYRRSSSDSLTAFLKLGRDRLEFRQYGQTSEKKLRDNLTNYIKSVGIHDIEIIDREKVEIPKRVFSTPAIESEEILHAVIKSPTPEWFLNDSVWRQWLSRLKEQNLTGERIYNLCQEMGAKWPKTNPWDKKTIEDFCSYSFSELFNTKYFRKVKLRSLIKAIAYLQTDSKRPIRKKTPEQKLDWLRSRILLNERETEIYRRRSRGEKLQDIGRLMHVTKEYIRQIQNRVFYKFRTPLGLEICSEYLDYRENDIWNTVSEGKRFLSKKGSLTADAVELREKDRFALFVAVGNQVKGEMFSDIIAEFLNQRFKHAFNYWFESPHEAMDFEASVSAVQSKLKQLDSPISIDALTSELPNIDPDLVILAVQSSKSVKSYKGFAVYGLMTPTVRRTIDALIPK